MSSELQFRSIPQFISSMPPSDYQGIMVKNVVNKIAFIFKEKSSDKKFSDIIMKVLKLSLMRNSPASREFFTLLSPSLQNKVFDSDQADRLCREERS
jgi:hypothetical protein